MFAFYSVNLPIFYFLHNVYIPNSICLALTWVHLPLKFHVNGVFHQPLAILLFKVHIAPVWSPRARLQTQALGPDGAAGSSCVGLRVALGEFVTSRVGSLEQAPESRSTSSQCLDSVTDTRYHTGYTV